MSCMTATVSPVLSRPTASISFPNTAVADVFPVAQATVADILPVQADCLADAWVDALDFVSSLTRIDAGLSLTVSLTCSTAVPEAPPYLDIEPKILWVWTMPADNNVYSNTTWNVD